MIHILKKYRERMLEWGTHELMLPVIRLVMQFPQFPYTKAELGSMPVGTLGREMFDFLEARHLHLLKNYESHDIKHVLFGYDSTEGGEAAMQYFFLGNGQRSFPVLVTVVVTLLIMPDHYGAFRKAYARGRLTPPVVGADWFALLPRQMADIKNELQIPSAF